MNAAIHSNSGKVSKSFIIAVSVVFLLAIGVAIVAPNLPRRGPSKGSACVMNLRAIEGAKATWELEKKKLPTDTPTDADLFGPANYIRQKPECPRGGTYTLGKISEKPRCSVAAHTY